MVFGQDMPALGSAFAQQAFATATVAVGLGSFALVLALVEQVGRVCSSSVGPVNHEQQSRWCLVPGMPQPSAACAGTRFTGCDPYPAHLCNR